MNEERKRRGLSNKFLAAVAIIALFLGAGSLYAVETTPPLTSLTSEQQQTVTVAGTIVDVQGEPVIGASVLEKGTSNGAMTDIDGKFSLKVKPGAILRITFVGYTPQEVKAQNGMRIVLKEDTGLLDEIVVVGYGTQKRANLTGAVSTVDLSKTMQGRPQQDVAKALQGAVPGLSITTSSGDIDANATMRIRGVGTLSNSEVSNPLIVVDGVPMDDISYLNTQDIESISVLKDAASTSIYGTRAAFGVILIQTKSAKPTDKVQINYSNNFAWDQATYLPDFGDVPSQLKAALEGKANAGQYEVELFGMYFDQLLPYAEKWKQQNKGKKGYGEMRPYQSDSNVGDYIILGSTPYYYADFDIQDIFYNNAAPSQSHNLSVQGTSGKTNYYLSFGYDQKEDLMKIHPSERKKYNASVNVTTNLYDWLQVGARLNYTRKNFSRADTWNSTYQYIWRWGSFFIPSGTINGYDTRVIAMRKQASDKVVTTDLTRMNAFLKADIVKGLTLNADFTYAIENMNSGSEDFSVYGVNWAGYPDPSYIVSKSSTAVWRDNSKQNTWTLNAYLNYAKDIKKNHHLNVMVGANAEEVEYTYLYGARSGLYDEGYPELNLANQDGQSISWKHTSRASAGYFGRINYDYKGIYLVELNGRYDGSSRFPHTDHWAFFPSASVGYRFSEEPYFAPLKKVVNNAKLRASWGEIGNEAIGDYMFEELISQRMNNASTGYVYWVDGNGTNANRLTMYNMPSLVSSSLTWERIRTTDIGLDLGFLQNELNVSFDWFQRENRDMLAPAQVRPNVLGASAPYENAGTLRTRGWELNIDWRHTFGEFDVYANFNLSDSQTKVTKWNNDSKLLNSYFTGKVYGDIYGFETERYFEESDFTGKVMQDGQWTGSWVYAPGVADQSGLESGSFHYGPGDIKFKDLNGDGKIDGGKGTADDHGDLKVIGNSLPRYEYSFHIGGAWRGLDVDFYFQGVGKREDWTTSSLNAPLMVGADLAIYSHQNDYNRVIYKDGGYTEIDHYEISQSNRYPRLYPGNNTAGTVPGIANGCNNYYPQTRYLTDMSYLRLKNVTIGYTLPKDWTRKAFIEKARIYLSGSNLFLLHKGNDLPVDPEISTGDGLTTGGWGRIAPITRTFSFGIQVTL